MAMSTIASQLPIQPTICLCLILLILDKISTNKYILKMLVM